MQHTVTLFIPLYEIIMRFLVLRFRRFILGMEFIEIATLRIGQSGKLIIIIIILNLGES